MKKTLLQKTLDLVRETDVNIAQMCRELGISKRWYFRFRDGDYSDPGVNRIEALHDYLVKHRKRAA